VKRQYAKPSLDGSWMAHERPNNERAIALKSINKHNQILLDYPVIDSTTSQIAAQPNSGNIKGNIRQLSYNNNINSNSNNSSNPKIDISAANLAISLIGLFDRIKCTLYNVINQECKNV
jgi:hypothetical protein